MPYRCKSCGRVFRKSDHLAQHVKAAHQPRPARRTVSGGRVYKTTGTRLSELDLHYGAYVVFEEFGFVAKEVWNTFAFTRVGDPTNFNPQLDPPTIDLKAEPGENA